MMMKTQNKKSKTKQITTTLFLISGLVFSNTATADLSDVWDAIREFGKKIPNVFEGVNDTFSDKQERRCSIIYERFDYTVTNTGSKTHTWQGDTLDFDNTCSIGAKKLGKKSKKWLDDNPGNLILENHLLKCKARGVENAYESSLDAGIYTTCKEKYQIKMIDMVLEDHRSKFTPEATITAVPLDQQATDFIVEKAEH